MTDVLSISALVVSVVGVLISFLKAAHIQKCKSACCMSDCTQPSIGNKKVKLVKKGSGLIIVECPPTPDTQSSEDIAEETPETIGEQPKISNC